MKYCRHTSYRANTAFKENSPNVAFTISKGAPRGRDKDKRGWGYLERYIDKEIPDILFEMTDKQFDVLIEAIHLGDGAKQANQPWERRSYHISKGNKRFIERLQILALMHGYKANISTETKHRDKPLYTLHLKKQNWTKVGSKYDNRPTWQKEKHTDETCWCVENELGTLVTRRNGKVAIVGNCQMIGRGTRLAPGKENLLILI